MFAGALVVRIFCVLAPCWQPVVYVLPGFGSRDGSRSPRPYLATLQRSLLVPTPGMAVNGITSVLWLPVGSL